MTAREALAEAERRLAAAGVETPRVDAEWLLAHVLGTTRSALLVKTLCTRIKRGLTRDEWKRFLPTGPRYTPEAARPCP